MQQFEWIYNALFFQEGTFVWQDSFETVDYSNWGSGEPNNASGDQDCVLLVKEW